MCALILSLLGQPRRLCRSGYGECSAGRMAQVDAIISHAEPYVHSAKKRARRLSLAAGDMLRRHSSMHTSQPKAHNK